MAQIQESLPPQLQGYAPSKPEKDAYQYLFERADTQQLGVLTGDLAVPFFSHSGLPPLLLGEVWQIADPDNSGFLSPDRFGVACRLIGHAQQRNRTGAPEVKPEWVTKAGPLPSFNKYPIPARLQQLADESLRSSSSSSPATGGPAPSSPAQPSRQASLAAPAPAAAGLTTISPTDKANYARAFAGANGGQVAGLLDGDKAREIWVKTQLPYDVLGQVWNLADTHSRGALDLTDFTIGMHLLHLVLDGSLPASSLPTVLDPKLYAAAAGLPAPGTGAVPASAQQQQQPTQGPQSPLRQASLPVAQQQRQPQPQPQPQQQQGPAWAITPAELADSNTWFDSLDSQSGRKGHIDGEQAVGFFGQSGLGVDQLAKVWDLADVQNAGHLTRETFAVAMHLLKRALSAPNTPLPDSLPTELVPPSMRQQQQQQPQQPSGPQRDLLDLLDEDDDASSSARAPVQTMQPQRTGTLSPQSTGQQPLAPMRAMSPQLTGQQQYPQRAMSPQLTGQGQRALSPQATGGSASYTLRGTVFPQPTGSGFGAGAGAAAGSGSGFESNFAPTQQQQQQAPRAAAAAAAATSSSFFDDNDDADLAASASALSAQEDSLRREASTLESQQTQSGKTRAELEMQVEASNREVAALQERISTARAAHEAELVRVDELRTRLKDGSALKERAKADLIRAESDLSALRMEKSELEGEVLRDKEEVRDLKRRVGIVEEEKRILRAEIDKAKKEVRQGKGLAAIARKQLSQGETDRGALERDLDDARNPPPEPAPAPVAAPSSSFAAALDSPSSTSIDAAAEAALARTAPTAAAAHAAAVPLPGTPAGAAALSPAASSVRSMNPFDRLIGSGGVSPQHTGSSPNASKNPFAFASAPAPPQQQAPAPAREDEQTLSRDAAPPSLAASSEPKDAEKDEASTSLPLAAAAAVGTGALAALGAAGAGIAHAFGVGSDEDGDKDKKEADSKREDVEADPFGVPTSGASAAAPTQASFDDGFGDDFAAAPSSSAAPLPGTFAATDDDAFGDDFAASAPPVTAAVVDEKDSSGFDDEFASGFGAAEGAAPASSTIAAPAHDEEAHVPAPIEGKLGEIEPQAGFPDAVRALDEHHFGPDAVQGTLADVEPDAGFDEAFREVEEHESAAPVVDKGKARAVEDDAADEGDVFGESAAAPIDADDVESDRGGASTLSDSSDDEDDGPEEAFSAAAARPRSRSGASSPDAGGFQTPAGATSTTDLGASTTSEIAAVTGESSSAAPRTLEDGVGPTSELVARREHETTTNSESGESFVHVNVGPTGTAESEHMLEPQAPASFEPASPALNPSPGAGSSTRRAAPPPPQRSVNAAPTPPEVPAFPPAAAVDNGFAAAFVPSSTSTASAPAASAEDDFDAAFTGLSASSAASPFPASSSEPTTAAPPVSQPLYDSFDSEFDDFGGGAENAARAASDSAKVNEAVGATSDFDDGAFADFDSSFPESGTMGAATQAPSQQGGNLDDDDDAFATFDDSFAATTPIPGSTTAMDAGPPQLGAPIGVGSTTTAAPSSATSTPHYAPPPGPPPPLAAAPAAAPAHNVDDFAGDTDEVRTIRQMGFSKQEALVALEKYDGDVNRAVNSLVG
ncbi:hypothetical protein JCM9279_002399 [Rhodotorula babjevae]